MANPRAEHYTLSENPGTTDNRTAIHETLNGCETRAVLPNDTAKTPATGQPALGIIQETLPADDSSLLPFIEVDTLMASEILDGANVNSLSEDIREYTTSSGDTVYAATDKGIGYKKCRNEDRIAIAPGNNLICVIDGIGSSINGDRAAQNIAQGFLDSADNTALAVSLGSYYLSQDGDPLDDNYGACFTSARIISSDGRKFVEISKAGNVKALILRNGKIIYESHDDTLAQGLIDNGSFTKEEALDFPDRNRVIAFIDGQNDKYETENPEVQKGDILILASDGITSNILPEEIEIEIQGLSPRQIIEKLSDITGKRMRDMNKIAEDTNKQGGRAATGKCADGYKSIPQSDNRAIAVIEIG